MENHFNEKYSKLTKENGMARYLNGLGVLIIIFGTIAGFVVAKEIGVIECILIIFSSIVSGMLFMGFGELLELIHQINSKLPSPKSKEEYLNHKYENIQHFEN